MERTDSTRQTTLHAAYPTGRWARLGLLAALAGLLLSGCEVLGLQTPEAASPAQAPEPTATAEVTDVRATAGPEPDADTTPAAEEEPGEITLTVWMPEPFAPASETPGGEALAGQIETFNASQSDLSAQVFVKLTTGPGSTLAYLRSAPDVAPSILPDIALLDLDALAQAAHDDLVVPVNTMVEPDEVAEFYPAAIELGTIDGILIGVPYLLEMQHIVYREVLFLQPPNTFERVLESPVAFVFPAGTTGSVNRTTLTQYMAGVDGELINEAGVPYIDEDVLTEVLEFYAQARDDEIVEPALLQITDPMETWDRYNARQVGLAAVRSTAYLEDRDSVATTRFAWLPTASGQPFTLVSGWLWVVTTRDPARQEAAIALIQHLLEPVNHASFTEAAGWLPSQPEALMVWSQEDGYASFADEVLANAEPLPEPGLQAIIGEAIQDALESVLLDDVAPAAAAAEAAERVAAPTNP